MSLRQRYCALRQDAGAWLAGRVGFPLAWGLPSWHRVGIYIYNYKLFAHPSSSSSLAISESQLSSCCSKSESESESENSIAHCLVGLGQGRGHLWPGWPPPGHTPRAALAVTVCKFIAPSKGGGLGRARFTPASHAGLVRADRLTSLQALRHG